MLEIDHLNKSYGDIRALKDLTFSVRPGEIFGFVGSNGAGKTTAMRIMLGVLSRDSGSVRWQGREIDFQMRTRVGYMPEERGLYPSMKVGRQLVHMAALHGLSKTDAVAAMEKWTERLGIASRRDDEVEKLSLGNQQRVQLAAALVHDPDILVLDEPFSGLDPVAVDVMASVLKESATSRGVPVIFSSHQLDLVERLCDRVGIISHGSLVALGTVAELRATDTPRLVIGSWDRESAEAIARAVATVPGAEVGGEAPSPADVVVQLKNNDPSLRSQVIAVAGQAGALREVRDSAPPLSELFRGVVDAASDDGAAPESTRREKKRGGLLTKLFSGKAKGDK